MIFFSVFFCFLEKWLYFTQSCFFSQFSRWKEKKKNKAAKGKNGFFTQSGFIFPIFKIPVKGTYWRCLNLSPKLDVSRLLMQCFLKVPMLFVNFYSESQIQNSYANIIQVQMMPKLRASFIKLCDPITADWIRLFYKSDSSAWRFASSTSFVLVVCYFFIQCWSHFQS